MDNNYNINQIIDSIVNKTAKIELRTEPILEEFFTINGLPMRKYDLLSIALKCSEKNLNDALNMIKMTEDMYYKHSDETFKIIADSLWDLIFYQKLKKNEIYYQNIFREHCTEILGKDYIWYNRKDLKMKRPDGWIKYKNSIIPVEMKVHKFNNAALEQLQIYMKIYECNFGIAIGNGINVALPENIIFVDIKEVKRYDR